MRGSIKIAPIRKKKKSEESMKMHSPVSVARKCSGRLLDMYVS